MGGPSRSSRQRRSLGNRSVSSRRFFSSPRNRTPSSAEPPLGIISSALLELTTRTDVQPSLPGSPRHSHGGK